LLQQFAVFRLLVFYIIRFSVDYRYVAKSLSVGRPHFYKYPFRAKHLRVARRVPQIHIVYGTIGFTECDFTAPQNAIRLQRQYIYFGAGFPLAAE